MLDYIVAFILLFSILCFIAYFTKKLVLIMKKYLCEYVKCKKTNNQ